MIGSVRMCEHSGHRWNSFVSAFLPPVRLLVVAPIFIVIFRFKIFSDKFDYIYNRRNVT